MRRQILNLIKSIFLIGFIIVAGLYVLNFTVTGDTAFVTKETNLYSMTDEKEVLKTLNPGTSVSLLTYSNNDKIVKVRYEDSDIGLDKHLSWVSVKSKTRDANLFNNENIVASKFESNTKFGYSFVSDEFEKEIDDAYDTVNATRN